MLLLQLLSLFEKEGIEHLVSGGYALCLSGAVRPTIDIDLLVPTYLLQSEKLRTLEWNLQQLDFDLHIEESHSEKKVYKKNLNEILCLHFDRNFSNYRTKSIRIQSHQIESIHPKDLILLKRKNPSEQNLEDIRALEVLYG